MNQKSHPASRLTEKQIETYLRDQVKKKGGLALKFVSPGTAGVPDRIIIMPNQPVFFIETKAPGKKATMLQESIKRKFEALGTKVYIVDNKNQIDEILTT